MRSSFRRRLLPSLLAAFLAAMIGVAAMPGAAVAEEGQSDTITWSVRPANADGADGRSWAEPQLDPGQSADEHLAVRNLSDRTVTFRLTAADGYFTEKGRFTMLPSGRPSVDAGTWISVQDSVSVEAGQTAVVPYLITVPENAEPGDHAAGIAASVLSGGGGEGNQVGVESRVGFRVMTRVTGELRPSLSTEHALGEYSLAWNPLSPGDVTASLDLVNTGNVRLDVTGFITAGGQRVSLPAAEGPAIELLPGARQSVTLRVADVWPTVWVPVDVTLRPVVIATHGEAAAAMDDVRTQIGAWAVPWPQLVVLVALTLLVVATLAGRARSRQRVATLVAEARAEGARSVTEDAASRRVDGVE